MSRAEVIRFPATETEALPKAKPRPLRKRPARRRPSRARRVAPVEKRRGAVATFARALTVLGLLSLGFGFFQTRIGDLSERQSQRTLRRSLTQTLAAGGGLGHDAQGNVGAIPAGSPVALLDIPRIGVHKVVVEGSSAEELKRGPGLVTTSKLPGQPGHGIIVGRRTTYGSPFRHLNVLSSGDEFTATTPFGRFRYRVRDVAMVRPGNVTTLKETPGGLLTLVTSDPPYVGGRALTVTATLEGEASTFPDPLRRATGTPGAIDFGGNGAGRIGVLVAGVLLLGAIIVSDVMYQRWRRWSTYLLTTPTILALAYAWMQNLSSVLPASL